MKKTLKSFIFLLLTSITLVQVNAQIVSINPQIGELCPNTSEGHLKSGDREFGGSVRNEFNIQLRISQNRQQLYANVTLKMRELYNNRPSSTKVEAEWTRVLYVAPQGRLINHFSVGKYNYLVNGVSERIKRDSQGSGTEFGFGCNDGQKYSVNLPYLGGEIVFIADTGAEDISSDNDCSCDSKIHAISFKRPIRIRLQ